MSAQSSSQETRRRRSSNHIRATLIVVTIVALAAMAVRARGWLSPRPTASTSAPASAPLNPQQGAQRSSQMEAEIITITPRGFEPAEITRPKGAFILVVDNRSGLDEITFRLDRETGDHLKEVRAPREQPDWDEVIDLPPGSYALMEADHPDWLCRITITAQ